MIVPAGPRIGFWLPVLIAWGAALLALYIHPAFWALFVVVLGVSIYIVLRQRKKGMPGGPWIN